MAISQSMHYSLEDASMQQKFWKAFRWHSEISRRLWGIDIEETLQPFERIVHVLLSPQSSSL